MSSTSSDQIEHTLRAQGKRVTPQRLLLLETIREQKGHLDADELYRLAKRKDPRLSLSTVYRTLSLLKELDLVDELHLAEEHHHYEIKDRSGAHHHLICLGCGQVIEFESPLTEGMKTKVAKERDFQITGVHIDLQGYCRECRERSKRREAR